MVYAGFDFSRAPRATTTGVIVIVIIEDAMRRAHRRPLDSGLDIPSRSVGSVRHVVGDGLCLVRVLAGSWQVLPRVVAGSWQVLGPLGAPCGSKNGASR